MGAHGFGRGEYKYFAYPLPSRWSRFARRSIHASRRSPIAGTGDGRVRRYPAEHATFLERCHEAGQTRPTPLLLRYGAGDYNCLHQDVYGEPRLSAAGGDPALRAGRDFTGGEFVLTEQRPRMQSRARSRR